MNAAQNVDINT